MRVMRRAATTGRTGQTKAFSTTSTITTTTDGRRYRLHLLYKNACVKRATYMQKKQVQDYGGRDQCALSTLVIGDDFAPAEPVQHTDRSGKGS